LPVKQEVPPAAIAPFDANQARGHQDAWARYLGIPVRYTNSIGMEFQLIPPGEFLMGSTDEEVAAALQVVDDTNADANIRFRIEHSERPQHKVVISRPFLLGTTKVTIGQFKQFSATGYITEAELAAKTGSGEPPAKRIKTYLDPGYRVTDDSPAAVITWNDAVAYCQWLSSRENRKYRLPTEAEWEYACRAGTTTAYSFGDDYKELAEYGWHNANAENAAHAGGRLLPNPFGLFDLHGNLMEWCGDFFDETWYRRSPEVDPLGPSRGIPRVLRGGSWYSFPSYSRSASRHLFAPSDRYNTNGFRCVLELESSARVK
jgi:formylglycine-generating enzyme required for sulfatase activity